MSQLIKRGSIYYICAYQDGRRVRLSTKTGSRREAMAVLARFLASGSVEEPDPASPPVQDMPKKVPQMPVEEPQAVTPSLPLGTMPAAIPEAFQTAYAGAGNMVFVPMPSPSFKTITMEDVLAMWLAAKAHKKSLADDEIRGTAIVRLLNPKRLIHEIGPACVEKLQRDLHAEKARSIATVNRHLVLLKSMLALAEARGYQTQKPFLTVKIRKEHNARDRIITEEEYQKMIAELAKPSNRPATVRLSRQLRLAIIIGYHTGMRQGEILSLTWGQIDFKAAILKLASGQTKTGQGRRVPLHTEVLETLLSLYEAERKPASQTLVLGYLRDASYLSSAFHRLARRLKLQDCRFHDLRHTVITRLRRTGVDIMTIQRISGHKTLEMLQRYNTIDDADLKAAINRL